MNVLTKSLIIMVVLISLTSLTTAQMGMTNGGGWKLIKQENIGTLFKVSIDNAHDTVHLEPKKAVKTELVRKNYASLTNRVVANIIKKKKLPKTNIYEIQKLNEKKLSIDRTRITNDLRRINKYPVSLDILTEEPNEMIDCNITQKECIGDWDKAGGCCFTPRNHTATIERILKHIPLGYINPTQPVSLKGLLAKLPNNVKGRLKIGWHTIELVGTAYTSEPDHYIKLVAENGGIGNSWSNAFNFTYIIDYFKEHPIAPIVYPYPINDSTEDSDWNWYWGTYTTATIRSYKDDTIVELDNTTGFTPTGQVRNLQSAYTDYVDYTGVNSTALTGCTWGNYIYGSSYIESYIFPGDEIFQLKTGNWAYDTSDYQVGSNSIKYTHDNDGSKVLVMANGKIDDELAADMIKKNMYAAEKIGFWVRSYSGGGNVNNITSQENANETGCSGLWEASYPCSQTYDGNWDSYGQGQYHADAYAYYNYSIPAHANSSSLWEVKDGQHYQNLTLSSSCWDEAIANGSKLQLRMYTHSPDDYWQCYNTTHDWETLLTSSAYEIYEERMNWNETAAVGENPTNVVVDSIETRDFYSTNNLYRYGKDIPVSVMLNDTEWHWLEYDFRELGLGIKRSSRDWQHDVDSFIVKFTNVSNGDVIKIDGVKWWIDNPTPREIKPNVYLFPIGIYDYQVQSYDFYFWDYGHNVIFNMPVSNAFYYYQRAQKSHIKFGYEGEGYPTSKNPQGEVIFWNSWSNGYINFWFLGDSSYPENYEFRLDGVHFTSASSTLDGMYPRLNSFGYGNNSIKDSILEQIGDFFIGSFETVDNVQVKGNRYTPWGTQPDGATTNNFKVWLNQNYMWIDLGTARHFNINSARNHNGYYWLYGRSYGHKSETETDFVDCEFPADFFDSDAYYTFSWGIFDTYSEGYYNHPHWWKIGNSVQVIAKDDAGNPIPNATVTVYQNNGTVVWNGTTDANGETERFNTFWRQTYISAGDGSASTHNVYMNNKDNDKDYDWGWATGWTHTFNPFTITITKNNYQTITIINDLNKTNDLTGYTFETSLPQQPTATTNAATSLLTLPPAPNNNMILPLLTILLALIFILIGGELTRAK